jgi:serine/threonine-protein kinase
MQAPILKFGKYEVEEEIGRGGMATVYKGRLRGAMGFEKAVAIKVLSEEGQKDREVLGLFIEEAKLGAMLQHPNIASVMDFGEVEGKYFMAMEYVDGIALSDLLRKKKVLSASAVAHILGQVLEGLEYAHSLSDKKGKPLGIVHRDISPQNVLLDKSGLVRICDFGIAKASESSHVTKEGYVRGKIAYMSPEQAIGQDIDSRSDLYSLALTVVAALSGKEPFSIGKEQDALAVVAQGYPLQNLDNLAIPDELKGILKQALQKNADERFQFASDFIKSLKEAGLYPNEHGRRELSEAVSGTSRKKTKIKKEEKVQKTSQSSTAYRNLLILLGIILFVSIVFALLGIRLPRVEGEMQMDARVSETEP